MSEQPAGQLEYRAATLTDVSYPARLVSVVVMPYEEECLIEYQGRMIEEIVSRGAFDGIQRRPNRIKANRDHDERRVVGKAVTLHPERDEGLVADIKISKTPLGEETLELAADGVLDVSAGFLPMPGGEKWEGRSRRRLNKCWLGHVGFVSEPAYVGARVLSVRSQGEPVEGVVAATPNLDMVRNWRLQEEYARISRQVV